MADVAPENLTVQQLKSALTEYGYEDRITAKKLNKSELVQLYRELITPKKAVVAPRQGTRRDEKSAGIQHMYDDDSSRDPSPATHVRKAITRGTPNVAKPSPLAAPRGTSSRRSTRPTREPSVGRTRSPSLTKENVFQTGSARKGVRERSVPVDRESESPARSSVRSLRSPSVSLSENSDFTGDDESRPRRAGKGCPRWLLPVVMFACVLIVGYWSWMARYPCAGRPDGTLVRHGQCIGEQLRCDFDAYASEGGASCVRDVPYDDKVGQAATWLVGALASARGQYECNERASKGLTVAEASDQAGRTFRIDEGKKRFLDEAAIKANEHCGGCVKRLNDDHGRPLLMVDVAMARKGLVCRVTEGLTYLAWLLVGVLAIAIVLYVITWRQSQRRAREAQIESAAHMLKKAAQQQRHLNPQGHLVIDYIKEEWHGQFDADAIDQAVELIRGDARLRIKKKLVHGVERRVVEWLDMSSTNTPVVGSPAGHAHTVADPSPVRHEELSLYPTL